MGQEALMVLFSLLLKKEANVPASELIIISQLFMPILTVSRICKMNMAMVDQTLCGQQYLNFLKQLQGNSGIRVTIHGMDSQREMLSRLRAQSPGVKIPGMFLAGTDRQYHGGIN